MQELERGITLSPVIIKAVRIRKRYLVALALLAFLSFYLTRAQIDRAERQTVEVMSRALAGRVIVVDPGHGGDDQVLSGKRGRKKLLMVGKLLAKNLAGGAGPDGGKRTATSVIRLQPDYGKKGRTGKA